MKLDSLQKYAANRVINIEKLFNTWEPRKSYEFINIMKLKKTYYHINYYINETNICN